MPNLPWWVPLLSALFGGCIAIAGAMLTEVYKQRQQRRALALALRGEMLAIIKIAEIRGYERILAQTALRLRDGESAWLSQLRIERNYFPIYEQNAAKIGMLPPEIAERIARAYVYANSFIEDATIPRPEKLDARHLPYIEQVGEVLRRALQEAQEASELIEMEFIRKC